MCGRFILTLEASQLEQEFGIRELPPDWQPRYNVAPTQPVAVVASEERRIEWMRWGLIPSWAKDPAIGNRLINARAETLTEKPSFRKAFQTRRCLILSNGFFEWHRPAEKGKKAVPYLFQRKNEQPFAFAGLWETWKTPEGDWLRSCTLITCKANELVGQIHDRMPVMLDGTQAWSWMQPGAGVDPLSLLVPYPAEEMKAHPVSTLVSRPGVDTPDIIKPVD